MAAPNIMPAEERLLRVLNRIESPGARKIVLMAKFERGELSPFALQRLICAAGLEAE